MGTPVGAGGGGGVGSCCLCCKAVERVTGLVGGTVLGDTGEVGGGELDGSWEGEVVM